MRTETIEAVQRLANAGGFRGTETVLRKYWAELSSSEGRELLAYQLTRHTPLTRDHRLLAARLRAIDRALAEGLDAAFTGYDAATEAVVSLLNAWDWDKVRETVEAHRQHLFPEVADIAFSDLLMQPGETDLESHIFAGWTLIKQCRELGVEAAFESQRKPSRGVVLGPEVAKDLAGAKSPEDLSRRLEALPDIASRQARRQDGETQLSQWPGREDYSAAMRALAAPSELPRRIITCQTALASIDRVKLPIVWALVTLDLADALLQQIRQSGPAPMTEVIALYRDALSTLTPEGEPDQFAHAQQYLGDALLFNSLGDQGDNAEAAIPCYETALGLQRMGVETIPSATISAHLGEALLRRSHGDPSIDVDRVIGLLEPVVGMLEKREDPPALLASARLTLASALTRCISGSHDENLRKAAGQLRNAIEEVGPDIRPDIWAMANTQLGEVNLARTQADLAERDTLLLRAENCFRAALKRADAPPRILARAHAGLGWALGDQADADAQWQAIHQYEAAITLYQAMGPALLTELGAVHHNLGLLHAKRAVGTLVTEIVNAERHFLAALAVFLPETCPVERRDTLRPLGAMYFKAQRWADALPYLEESIALSAGVLAGRYTEIGKEEDVVWNRDLYGQAAYCQLRLGRPGEALQTIEHGKARMLSEALVWKELYNSSELSASDQKALRFAHDQIMRLEAQTRQARGSRDAQRLGHLGRQLRDAYRHLATLSSFTQGSMPAELDLNAMLAEIPPGGALIVPIVTTQGSAALVVPAGADTVSSQHIVELGLLSMSKLADLVNGWLNANLAWQRDPASFPQLLETLDTLCSELWEVLLGTVHARLCELGVVRPASIVFIPTGWLGLLPLHAARHEVNDRWFTFGMDFVVSYTPSVNMLRSCRRRLRSNQRRGRTLLAISNPTDDLRFADAEVSAIIELFQQGDSEGKAARVLASKAATRSSLVPELADRQYIHFACHADFNWTSAGESGLRLASGDWFRLADILSPTVDLNSSRLVTLSACETAMTEFAKMPDEFVGLPGAFLEAGAPAVIGSLWPVDDISTRLLLVEMYRQHFQGAAVAVALQRSQRWLSESTAAGLGLASAYQLAYETSAGTDMGALENWQYYCAHPDVFPFAHPFYWAGFTLAGCL